MRTFLGVTFLLLLAACASQALSESQSKYEMGADEYGPVPESDPDRVISVQDCTKAVSLDGGNLICK
jgi:uncharacterized lipoprotein YmbA